MTTMSTELALPAPASTLTAWAEEAEAAAGIARALVGTRFVPDSLRLVDAQGRPDIDGTVAQVAAALLTGQELGFNPMASLRAIDVIPPGSGNPALRSHALRAILLHHGHLVWVVESTKTRAVVRGIRAGTDITQESVWTYQRAKEMGLRGFNDPKGSWQRQPQTMLVNRATAEVARWVAADAIMGLPYLTDEFEDGTGVEPVPEGAAGGDSPSSPPSRRRRRPKGGAALAALPSPSTDPHDGTGPEAGEAPAEAAPDPSPRISAAQRGRMWAGLKRLGYTAADREAVLAMLSRWIGRELPSTTDLSEDEASTVLTEIEAEEVRRAAQDREAAEREAAQ
jgi:hypothetical protein